VLTGIERDMEGRGRDDVGTCITNTVSKSKRISGGARHHGAIYSQG
jgi:hypothetical protein